MTAFDPLALGRTLDLVWTSPPAIEQHADLVELRGEVQAHPAPDALETALGALGFTCAHTRGPAFPRQAASHTVHAKKGAERLRVVLLGAPRDDDGRSPVRLTLSWTSGRRPRIEGEVHVWSGCSWPIFFDEARLHHESRAMLVVEGKLDATASAFARCRDRYRQWAAASGLAPHVPFEPDLAGDLVVADAHFELTLTDRQPWVTLTVARRDAE